MGGIVSRTLNKTYKFKSFLSVLFIKNISSENKVREVELEETNPWLKQVDGNNK